MPSITFCSTPWSAIQGSALRSRKFRRDLNGRRCRLLIGWCDVVLVLRTLPILDFRLDIHTISPTLCSIHQSGNLAAKSSSAPPLAEWLPAVRGRGGWGWGWGWGGLGRLRQQPWPVGSSHDRSAAATAGRQWLRPVLAQQRPLSSGHGSGSVGASSDATSNPDMSPKLLFQSGLIGADLQ
jgi:hypothetical protein